MGLLRIALLKDVKPCSFFQFESVGIVRLARANQSLPFNGPDDILDVRPITVNQTKILHQVLHVAVGAFYVETGLRHGFRH